MNIFLRIVQKFLEITFLFILNFIYRIKFKKISSIKVDNKNNNVKFSIILPTYNSNPKYLNKCINSVVNQNYKNWELCISDDGSDNKKTLRILKNYSTHKQIKINFNKINQHISDNSNIACELSTGKYLCFLDHDDLLWPNTLSEINNILEKNPKIKFIYTDQGKILGNKHIEPFLKPDFDQNLIKSVNYFNHLTVIKKSVFIRLGGFIKGIEGAQDWDLYLRMLNIVKPIEIHHINKILYSWRITPSSTSGSMVKTYAYQNQEKVLKSNFPKYNIKRTPYLGIWQINNLNYIKPYQIYLQSIIRLLNT